MNTPKKAAAKPRPAKASGKPAPIVPVQPAARTAPPTAIAETVVQLVRYDLLSRAPENVRHTRESEDVLELADDIAAHGLLQSLIGYAGEEGAVLIVGGGRRLAALATLHTRGIIDDAYRVPVVVRDQADAIELSLAENLARRDMSPVDEFLAFEQLMRPGTIDAAGLAKRFGFSERYVKQRLRLAQLAPEILDALRDRKLSLDAAMAYASSQDLDAQVTVFKAQSRAGAYRPHDPDTVRRDLSTKTLYASGALATFVGAEAYEAAGGRYDDDLFANPLAAENRRLADGALVRRLAREKIEESLIRFVSAKNAAGAGINAGALIAPDIDVAYWQWTKPKAPAGFVMVECPYDNEKRWNAARNCGAQVKGVVGLDSKGELVLVESVFFVDAAKLKEVKPPETREVYRQPTPEEYEERRRTADIEMWERRLALGGFDDTKFAGRAFWPPDYERSSERHSHPALGDGYMVNVRMFVTKDDAEAQLEAATARLDEIKAERLAAAAEEEARKKGLSNAHDARVAEIAAADPEPAVIIADETVLFRWGDGSYMDVADEGEEADNGFDELTQLLAEVSAIGSTFETVDAYRAALEAGEVEGLNQDQVA